MRFMESPEELKKTFERAKEKYSVALVKISEAKLDDEGLKLAAQEANDAWMEYKKADLAISNYSTFKQLGDLYGC